MIWRIRVTRVLQTHGSVRGSTAPARTCGTPLSFYVDVRRFVAIEAGEEEPIWSGDATDAWHSGAPALPSRSHSDIRGQLTNVLGTRSRTADCQVRLSLLSPGSPPTT